jgi:hypothetical protein
MPISQLEGKKLNLYEEEKPKKITKTTFLSPKISQSLDNPSSKN